MDETQFLGPVLMVGAVCGGLSAYYITYSPPVDLATTVLKLPLFLILMVLCSAVWSMLFAFLLQDLIDGMRWMYRKLPL